MRRQEMATQLQLKIRRYDPGTRERSFAAMMFPTKPMMPVGMNRIAVSRGPYPR
jgi:hypothetical protein